MIICVDFDGTVVTHEYPKIGRDIGAIPILKKIAKKHKLILWTMRSDKSLTDAVNWFNDNDIKLWGVNSNPNQCSWTSSPKAYAELYIDDAALGCPLIYNEPERPYVDWIKVEEILIDKGIL